LAILTYIILNELFSRTSKWFTSNFICC